VHKTRKANTVQGLKCHLEKCHKISIGAYTVGLHEESGINNNHPQKGETKLDEVLAAHRADRLGD